YVYHRYLHSFPTRRSSDLMEVISLVRVDGKLVDRTHRIGLRSSDFSGRHSIRVAMFSPSCIMILSRLSSRSLSSSQSIKSVTMRSEEHTSELQSRENLVCR